MSQTVSMSLTNSPAYCECKAQLFYDKQQDLHSLRIVFGDEGEVQVTLYDDGMTALFNQLTQLAVDWKSYCVLSD